MKGEANRLGEFFVTWKVNGCCGFLAKIVIELVDGAEIGVVLFGLNCAWDQRVEKFVVGSDSKNVVGWLNDEVKLLIGSGSYICHG